MRSLTRGFVVAAASVLVLAATTFGSRASVLDHATFDDGLGNVHTGKHPHGKGYEIGVNATLSIRLDEASLVEELYRSKTTAPARDLDRRVRMLEKGVAGFLESEILFLEWRSVRLRILRLEQELSRAVGPPDADTRASLLERSSRLRREEVRAMSDFSRHTRDLLLELRRDPRIEENLQDLVLLGSFAQIAGALEMDLQRLRAELDAEVRENRRFVYVIGWLVTAGGRAVPVHLEGYDTHPTGAPLLYDPDRFVIDRRTLDELEQAELIARLFRDLRDGTLRKRIRESLRELRRGLDELLKTIETDVVARNLRELAEELERLADETLDPLVDRIDEARERILSLGDVPELGETGSAERLAEIARLLRESLARIKGTFESLPSALESLLEQAEAAFRGRGLRMRDDLRAALVRARDDFLTSQEYFESLHADARAILDALDLGADVEAEAIRLSVPRELVEGVSLDTRVDLLTVPGVSRRPGDRLVVRTRLVERRDPEGQPTTVAQDSQVFFLTQYGWYREVRGGLIFVDPRNEEPPSEQSWEPAPSLGYFWHRGLRNKPGWNRGLNIGVGFTFTLLDLDESKDFELGIAAGATFYRDLLWTGYGRDLQAETDFVYVGINPIALVGLVSRSRSSSHVSPALDGAGGVGPPRNTPGIPSSARLASPADGSPKYATNF